MHIWITNDFYFLLALIIYNVNAKIKQIHLYILS